MKKQSDKGSDAGKLDAFSSATDMLRALRRHHVSAVELLDLHLLMGSRATPRTIWPGLQSESAIALASARSLSSGTSFSRQSTSSMPFRIPTHHQRGGRLM